MKNEITLKPYSIWQGNSKYNTEYRMKRVKELAKKEVITK